MKFKKLKKGAGVEWIIIFTALSMLFSVMICINYYYVIRSEARKLAINISNSIILDEKYKKRFSGINLKEDFEEIISKLNILYEQYGDNFIEYVKKMSFFDNYNLIMPTANKICVLLNDNKFYTLNNNELEEIKGNFKSFHENKENLLQYIPLFNSNPKEVENFFLPTFTKQGIEKILNNNFNDKEKGFFDKFNNEERKIINEEKTREVINILLKNYNENRGRNAFKGFTIKFEDNSDEKKELYKVNEDLSKNSVSFFFYSYINKNESLFNEGFEELNTLNYKIRSINSKNANDTSNEKNDHYFYYPNSLHLVICCNIYIPFINSKSFELKYPIDICIEHKGLE